MKIGKNMNFMGFMKFWVICFFGVMLSIGIAQADIYLENTIGCPTCTDGNTTYNPATRSCGSGSETVYTSLASFNNNIQSGRNNYIRSGTYTRTTPNTFEGALFINGQNGTAGAYTVVSAYPGEERQVVIGTDPNKLRYNPNPGDTGFTNSSRYYPNPAITVAHTSYVRVSGFKTYGQVFINAYNSTVMDTHDVILEGCDIGGGGPNENQGQVVKLHTVYDVTVINNKIHHSAWGESDINGSALMGYNFSATIENNEFYDNWASDIRLKDTGYNQGRTIEIKNNFFRPSTIYKSNGTGVQGIAQDVGVDYVMIHNNIFYKKNIAIMWDGTATIASIAYNNTFVDCDYDINTWWSGTKVQSYNNLHYHPNTGDVFYDVQASPMSEIQSNYNLFYSVPRDTKFRNLYSTVGSQLSAWVSYSGRDVSSMEANPSFVNSQGSQPESFKRSNYPENFQGSSYGNRAGAYENGSEVIGTDWTGSFIPSPASPKNLRVASSGS